MIDAGLIEALKELEAEYSKRAKESEDKTLREFAEYTKTFREILEKKCWEEVKAVTGFGSE